MYSLGIVPVVILRIKLYANILFVDVNYSISKEVKARKNTVN